MRKQYCLLLSLAVVLVSFGCRTNEDAKNQELLDSFKGRYHLPQDNPARYALNEIGTRKSWRAFKLLREEWPGTDEERQEAAERLQKLREQIEIGLKWPYKTPPTFEIPFTKTAPKIDGNINDSCWNKALTFSGSFPTNVVNKNDDGCIWKMMWDKNYIYVGAYFPDKHIYAFEIPEKPYRADSLEVFIMPSKRMKKYWEVVVGCDGNLFDGFHCNNKYGKWAADPAATINGLKYKTSQSDKGFSIEIAIPFLGLPNYMLGNPPKAGQTLYFALLRTDKNSKDGKVDFFSAFPLLYGGHNIFGHAKGILK